MTHGESIFGIKYSNRAAKQYPNFSLWHKKQKSAKEVFEDEES